MWRRKVQSIAGTSFSVTLPKEWVMRNKLDRKGELAITENADKTLSLSFSQKAEPELESISLSIEEYGTYIEQILFSVYYLGVENISIVSKKEIDKDLRMRIRKTLDYMSGTEISFEDKNSIKIRVLLDKSKVDITQILFRISLIVDSSITTLTSDNNPKEIRLNEGEIDRLYHLAAKMISSSLIESEALRSSKIVNVTLIPCFLMISKRLENLGDSINYLSKHLRRTKTRLKKHEKEILHFVKREVTRSISFFLKDQEKIFEKTNRSTIDSIKQEIKEIDSIVISNYISEIMRYLLDIEDEIVNLSFYERLRNKKAI